MFFSFTPLKRQKGRGTHIFHVLYSYVTMSQNELNEEILNFDQVLVIANSFIIF